jgi:RNA recognition motif-containing protein
MKLFVANISYKITEAELKQLFTQYGQVESIKLPADKETGKRKGFGFIEMPVNEQAQKAIDALNGKEFNGRKLAVSKATEMEQHAPSFAPQQHKRQRIVKEPFRNDAEELDGNRR